VRIAIDYTPALRQGAGIGRYTRSLVDALARLDRDNVYTLLSFGPPPPGSRWGRWPANYRLRTVQLPSRWMTILWYRLRLPVPLEWLAGPHDLYHSTDFTLPPLVRARGVVTVHDLSFLTVPECADPGLRTLLRSAVPAALTRAHRILADSESTRQDIVRLLGVSGAKVDVVLCGVEERFRPIREPEQLLTLRQRYRLPERFILTLGTLEPRKNHAGLINAYASLRNRTAGLPPLVIAGGKGWLFDEVTAQVQREGLDSDVLFAGYVADEDLPALYNAADLFVFPSLYEGFGLPPLEALACGTPVVAANNSSLPEVIGEAGLLVDARDTDALAEAMHAALMDRDLRRHLAERGPVQAARFTWTNAARALLEAYRCAALA
jgi:glycosyltransferase involved in cell wall biosynthesis